MMGVPHSVEIEREGESERKRELEMVFYGTSAAEVISARMRPKNHSVCRSVRVVLQAKSNYQLTFDEERA